MHEATDDRSYGIPLDIQYNTVIAVLYATYVPAQIPSNMVCGEELHKVSSPSSRLGEHVDPEPYIKVTCQFILHETV